MRVHAGLVDCRLCPRLVEWRERKATTERRVAFADQPYWGRPVPSFGPIDAPILIVGLAPAAHGANRTGRMFTGDRSGEWLYRALHRVGLATSPDHEDPDLELIGCRITAVCHCAPPDNRPTPEEVTTCVDTWLVPEMAAVASRVVVALGGLAWNRVLRAGPGWGWEVPRPRPRFGHGAEISIPGGPVLLGTYHPSQQNTFTGKLTRAMFDDIWQRAVLIQGGTTPL
ncbi:MAG TPA: uracil-DNA glycosylase [Acidimicrobiia bacterium]|nr:uracil-DNA glycosylase [Acidimicrobiia bacterium]